MYKETIDNIIGIINEKDFFYADDIESILCPAVFVLENMKISNLMQLLRTKKSHLAIVTDEYGGTVGVASLEDVLEELVGEIWDEHDIVKEELIKLSPNRYKVSGSANLDKMFETFEIEPDEEFDSTSVGGWITEYLGYVPKNGERFDYGCLHILILKTEQNRIAELLITKKTASSASDK